MSSSASVGGRCIIRSKPSAICACCSRSTEIVRLDGSATSPRHANTAKITAPATRKWTSGSPVQPGRFTAPSSLALLLFQPDRRGIGAFLRHRFGHRVCGKFDPEAHRSEEHTSELQSLMRISYAVFCLKKKK